MRAKLGGRGLPSGVAGHTRLFSVTESRGRSAWRGERDCVSNDSRSGGGRENLRVSWYRQVQVGTN